MTQFFFHFFSVLFFFASGAVISRSLTLQLIVAASIDSAAPIVNPHSSQRQKRSLGSAEQQFEFCSPCLRSQRRIIDSIYCS